MYATRSSENIEETFETSEVPESLKETEKDS
jgi:hypothetical protein